MPAYDPSPTSAAIEVLRRVGIVVASGTVSDWVIRLPDETHHAVNVKAFNRTPSPSWILNHQADHPDRRIMIVARNPSRQLEEYAQTGSVDLVDMTTGTVVIAGHEWARPKADSHPRRSGKPAWGRWGVMRALCLLEEPLTQTEIAEYVGIAQSAVSQSLRDLKFIDRPDRGWVATDKRSLLEEWLSCYSGPGGTSTYWYGLGDVATQAAAAVDLTAELQVRHLLSGDLAADEYAPWRLPSTGRLYVDEIVDFSVVNLTPADEVDATFIATVPEDPTLWSTAHILDASPTLVDPLIILWDVARSSGADAVEAADKIMKEILS